MLRTIDDVVELRRWAESRGARPCRDEATGRLGLAWPGRPCRAREVGWDEFEPTFVLTRCVFVYDDAPSSDVCFLGPSDEARAFLARRAVGAPYAPPP